jgi:hypothetical protein
LGTLSYGIADYSNYELIYNFYTEKIGTQSSWVVEPIFLFLCKVSKFCGFSFPVFRGMYITVAVIVLLKGMSRYSKNNIIPLILYIVFPFALDIVQFRFFLAYAIVIYSITYLEKGDYRKYIAAVLIASTQQITSIFYLILLIVKLKKENFLKFIFIYTIVEFIIFSILSRGYLGGMIPLFSHYLEYSSSLYTINLCVLYLFMTSAIVSYDYFFIKNKDNIDVFLEKILYALFLFVPFILLNENFTRLYRGMVVLIYCRFFRRVNMGRDIEAASIMAFVFCGLMFFIHLSPHNVSHWERIIVPLFENNYLFNIIRNM